MKDSFLVDVGERLELKHKNGSFNIYSRYGDYLDSICLKKESLLRRAILENRQVRVYLSQRPLSLNSDKYDSFNVIVFYKEN